MKKKEILLLQILKENSLDVSIGGNIALTVNQKNMINDIEKNLEKKNEESNFDDMNKIRKTINIIIKNEKNKFGYIKQNILLILIIFFITSLNQIHLIFNYLFYIQVLQNYYSFSNFIKLIINSEFLFLVQY